MMMIVSSCILYNNYYTTNLQLILYHYKIPYSRKIWRGIKFGGLAVYLNNRQIKIRQNFLLA